MTPNLPVLLDQWGRPVVRQQLTTRVAQADIQGVRQAVRDSASRGLTPQRLARMIRSADENDPEAYLALAEEMEEKDLHYVSVLGTRKRQVAQLPISVDAASKDTADQVAAEAVQEDLIDSGVIDRFLFDMLDAVGKGFSLGETDWTMTAARWVPRCIDYVDPRFVRFDRATMRIPMLLDNNGVAQTLAPFKFVWLQLGAKSGIPIRGGLARNAAWCFLFKNFGLKDWVQFAETYGKPLRVGKYPTGASEDDKDAMLDALAQLGVDAAAAIPQQMMIEFVEAAQKGASSDLFKALLTYCDEQISKAVLGQTGTTDSKGANGLGSGTEHTQVRTDIERADANAVAASLNLYLVKPYIDLNFGPRRKYPWLRIGRADPVDAKAMTDMAAQLVPLGLRVSQADLRAAVGFTEPKEDDEVLRPASPLTAPDMILPPRATMARALAASIEAGNDPDAIDKAVSAAMDDWKEVIDPIASEILALAAKAKSLDELKASLRTLYPTLDVGALTDKLALLGFQALGGGALNDQLRGH